MKCLARCLALFLLLCSTAAFAQLPTGAVKHVIVVMQENRSIDNLFGADSALISAGANIYGAGATGNCIHGSQPLQPYYLDACFDPNHGHSTGWVPTYDSGAMDGACTIQDTNASCATGGLINYPNYTYVDNSASLVQPYFDIANKYGFANYMFQTNQGPSFPAHQFLFSGTSAPDFYNDPAGTSCTNLLSGNSYPCWQWFVAENPATSTGPSSTTGCTISTTLGQTVEGLDPNILDPEDNSYVPPGYTAGFPCYKHPSEQDVLGSISWKYYSPFTQTPNSSIWTAPNALSWVCVPSGGNCTGTHWSQVVSPTTQTADQGLLLNDIENTNCTALPAVSFAVPDGRWSDHPGCNPNGCTVNSGKQSGEDGGPSYVAAIVNAVGNNTTCNYWNSTIILITWDDWGGFYDHVSPAASAGGPGTTGYPGQIQSQTYVYGFRVPLLVVSKYVKSNTSLGGYISGGSTPNCANGGPYCHDFGSILGFIKQVFSLGYIGSSSYPYADYFAPDQYVSHPSGCTATTCPFPLADFFSANASRTFAPITSAKYPEPCFHFPNKPSGSSPCFGTTTAQSPDNDDADEQ